MKVVTHYIIQAKARSFANRAVYQDMYTNINAAKFSQKWVDGFMIHHNLVNRRKTTVAQRLPDDYVELQNSFLSYILYQRKENQYPLSLIANMDETPLSFNCQIVLRLSNVVPKLFQFYQQVTKDQISPLC